MERTNSSRSRDFPTPASPTTVTSRGRRLGDGLRERVAKDRELAIPADHGRVEAPRALPALEQRDEPVCGHGLRLALELERLDRLDLDVVADEPVGEVAEEHFALAGRLLEPRSHVHGVARDEPLPGGRVAGYDLAGVHARAVREAHAEDAVELVVERAERSLHSRRRAHRAQGVVLVQPGQAEDGHDGVADELLDDSAVLLELGAHGVEVPSHHLAQGLGVETLAHARRALEVGEDDRHDLSHLLWRRRDLERGAAGEAELRDLGVLGTALAADGHRPSLPRRGNPCGGQVLIERLPILNEIPPERGRPIRLSGRIGE